MSVVIAGSGISGWMVAAEIKLLNPDIDVVVISNLRPGNSAIAGQRYRIRMGGYKRFEELHDWYDSHGDLSSTTKQFFAVGRKQMVFWRSFDPGKYQIDLPVLSSRDSPDWFGPQLGEVTGSGSGRGGTVLRWFKKLNMALGVRFLEQTVKRVVIENDTVTHLVVVDRSGVASSLHADSFVLATGAPSGSMFFSTNVQNWDSLLPALFIEGLAIEDESVFMLHMAARCDETGRPKNGCHETDVLSDCEALLPRGGNGNWEQDPEITELLRAHRAHEKMQELCSKIIRHGGLVAYQNTRQRILARVSHHYSHLRMGTTDGVEVSGLKNCFVAGDMAGLGYWLGSRPRLPGTALLGCMVSATMIAHRLAQLPARGKVWSGAINERIDFPEMTPAQRTRLREVNTEGLFAFTCSERAGTERWSEKLRSEFPSNDPWVALSLKTAATCSARIATTAVSA